VAKYQLMLPCQNKDQLRLTKTRYALHHGERAENK